jgi:hypothetical protein
MKKKLKSMKKINRFMQDMNMLKIIIILFFLIPSSLYSQVLWGIDTDNPNLDSLSEKSVYDFEYVKIFNYGEQITLLKSHPPHHMAELVIDYLNCKLGEFIQRDSIPGGGIDFTSVYFTWRTHSKAVLLIVRLDRIKVDIVRLGRKE